MNYIHIHAPQPDARWMQRNVCPTCKRRTYMVSWHTPWYGSDTTCLRCGENWQDGEMSERPFMPAWRKKSIEAVKKRWRAGYGLRPAPGRAKVD